MELLDKKSVVTTLISAAIVLSSSAAVAGNPHNPNLDALTVISTISAVDGAIAGFICPDGSIVYDPRDECGIETIIYPISGDVFAATINASSGETIAGVIQLGTIEAVPEFSLDFFALGDPTVDWRNLPVLPWTMSKFEMEIGGSKFEHIEGMELDGAAFAALGPVEDPSSSGTASLRMGGCEGIVEVSGKGDYANMIGSLCLNGTFSFDQYFNGVGVSNCTLVLHEPWMY